MKTYSKENYKNFEAFLKDTNKELFKMFVGTSVVSKKYGTGQVLDVYIPELTDGARYDANGPVDLYFVITFPEVENKTFSIKSVLKVNSLEFEPGVLEKINKVFEDVQPSVEARLDELDEVRAKEIEEENRIRAEKAAEVKRQKEEAKFLVRKEKALAKLQKLKPENTKKLFDTPVSHYEVIGWMAKHCRSLRAAMPDWMEQQFVSMFGDVERYVVDSKKKTSGGFAYQWGLGLKITFDQEVSGALEQRATSKNKKIIDNVAFIWDLVENYGFKFGKKQDIDAIIEEVPTEYLPDFNRGFAM